MERIRMRLLQPSKSRKLLVRGKQLSNRAWLQAILGIRSGLKSSHWTYACVGFWGLADSRIAWCQEKADQNDLLVESCRLDVQTFIQYLHRITQAMFQNQVGWFHLREGTEFFICLACCTLGKYNLKTSVCPIANFYTTLIIADLAAAAVACPRSATWNRREAMHIIRMKNMLFSRSSLTTLILIKYLILGERTCLFHYSNHTSCIW